MQYVSGYRPGFTPYKRQYTRSGQYKNARYGPRASGSTPTKRMVSETKYVDGYYDTTAILELSGTADDDWAGAEANPRQSTAVYGCLPIPRQGTNYADRDGRRIYVKKLRIKGRIIWGTQAGATVAGAQRAARLVIVKDTRTNGATLSAENVIGAGLGSDGNAALSGDGGAINFPTDPDGWGRYKIMYDQWFTPPTQGAWGSGTANAGQVLANETPFDIVINANCYINFDDTAGAIGSVIDNSFHLLCANTATPMDNSLCYYARTSFVG